MRKEACLTRSPSIPWAGSRGANASDSSVGWEQSHSEKTLSFPPNLQIAAIHVGVSSWGGKSPWFSPASIEKRLVEGGMHQLVACASSWLSLQVWASWLNTARVGIYSSFFCM